MRGKNHTKKIIKLFCVKMLLLLFLLFS